MERYFKAESKKDWFTSVAITNEDIQTGCLMRIADSVEIMAKDRVELECKVKSQQETIDYLRDQRDRLERRISSMKGVITKLRNKK